MKNVWMGMAIATVVTIPAGGIAQNLSPAAQQQQSLPRARVINNGEQLRFRYEGQTWTVNASDLNVRVLDAVDCERAEVAESQVLSGQRFFGNSAVRVDRQTGNIAVGVLMEECYETQVSAVFVLDPQPGAYSIYRVQVPGDRPLPDEFSTFPLSTINRMGYLGDNLLVKHSDASGSQAIVVFRPARTPAGEYAGCVYTELVEGDRLCPTE